MTSGPNYVDYHTGTLQLTVRGSSLLTTGKVDIELANNVGISLPVVAGAQLASKRSVARSKAVSEGVVWLDRRREIVVRGRHNMEGADDP